MSRARLVAFASVAMVSWALWVVFSERALRTAPTAQTVATTFVAGTAVTGGYILASDAEVALDAAGVGYASLAGAFMAVGILAYYVSLSFGSTGVATTIAAMYFLPVTVIGALVLGEPLGATDVAGIAAAAIAIALLVR